MKKKWKIIGVGVTSFILLLFLLPPDHTSAGIVDAGIRMFNGILTNLATGIASWMFGLFETTILSETSFQNISDSFGSNFNYLVGLSQSFGLSLVTYFALQDAFVQLIKTGYGQRSEKTAAQIFGKAIISGVMVVSVRYVLDLMIAINNFTVKTIIAQGVTKDHLSNSFTINKDVAEFATDLVVLFLVYIIASLILSIMGAIRYAELAMVFVLSPVVLSGNVTGDNLKSLLLNATGIIFTQSAQVAALSLLFSNMVNGDATRMLFAIGIIVLLLRGSKILTNFLYSTGTGSAATTAMGASVRMMAARNIGGRAVRALKAV
ncbi:hypothetical protein ERICIV_04546 (plasmid) [Paenibacillus larvae subsp. larvae]|uniref:Conjugal transfer protein TrbL n=2 Tax=Paenibacillus larvae TaxID=1464 RepID=A0A2L1UK43_9BACL|nr:conjugal transfer protein TrbL family protein [Paenibacillus larvae]AQT87004.1 hypothetical protein B1222_23515 [Paenibacillus larvae subsp. pulvifaciens]AQZ49275.1 hypothetical protein B5S25_22475 [Paenibacillus larvae subsp. pulvifaciens]AVF28928.1 hypothetical protein ERICIII_04926 [Paenibacillus larvae subsp. larvae]AVF33310.1 hypothetical protein ERICIV_04546 [Paenibacillus larvae subsp. larvae]MBH0344816.1 hypothetical protein [Paenibacillus larvae]